MGWAACKTWSSNEFFSAAVLKQRKKASVKNPNTEADPVPFALFWKDFQQIAGSEISSNGVVPVLELQISQKKMTI
jgi:hypothetical protein